MTQRIDVIVDGRTVNTNQRSDNPEVWARVRRFSQTAGKVEIRRHTAPVPPSPPPNSQADPLELARNVCFFATVLDDAITYFNRLPKSWKAAFTADPSYRVTEQQIAAVQASGHRAYSWCDCRTTFPETAKAMAEGRDLSGWYGEAESWPAFAVAHKAEAPAVVGILSALTDTQLALVAAGGPPLFSNETYRNKPDQRHQPADWKNANKGVGGNCIAVYASPPPPEGEGAVYTPISEYLANGWFNPATDSIYTEGMLEADWKALLEVAR